LYCSTVLTLEGVTLVASSVPNQVQGWLLCRYEQVISVRNCTDYLIDQFCARMQQL